MRGITGDRLEAGWKVCLERLSFAEICALFPIVEEMNAKGFNNWGIVSDDFCDLTQWLSGVVGGKCNAIIEEVNRLEKKNKQIDEPVSSGVDLGKESETDMVTLKDGKGETLPEPKKAIDLIHEAINDCYSRMLHPKCILCRFDFYDQIVLELNNLTMGWVETDKPAEIFGIRLVRTPDVAKNVNKFEVIV